MASCGRSYIYLGRHHAPVVAARSRQHFPPSSVWLPNPTVSRRYYSVSWCLRCVRVGAGRPQVALRLLPQSAVWRGYHLKHLDLRRGRVATA